MDAFSAFRQGEIIASGTLHEVATSVHAQLGSAQGTCVVFDNAAVQVTELDLRGTAAEVAARYAPPPPEPQAGSDPEPQTRGRGRPKLGVVGREVTLLPRHWEWLKAQPGGASRTLRRLVESARKASAAKDAQRAAQNRAYAFMSVLLGDAPGYEEAVRALYAGDRVVFHALAAVWPPALAERACTYAAPAWLDDEPQEDVT